MLSLSGEAGGKHPAGNYGSFLVLEAPASELIRRCADDIVEMAPARSSFQLGRDLRDVSALEARACEFIY